MKNDLIEQHDYRRKDLSIPRCTGSLSPSQPRILCLPYVLPGVVGQSLPSRGGLLEEN